MLINKYILLYLILIFRWLAVDYYLFKVESTINILQQLDIIGRTSELAKLFGIQFYEVLSRGSQVSSHGSNNFTDIFFYILKYGV